MKIIPSLVVLPNYRATGTLFRELLDQVVHTTEDVTGNIGKVAEFLGVSHNSVRRWLDGSLLPHKMLQDIFITSVLQPTFAESYERLIEAKSELERELREASETISKQNAEIARLTYCIKQRNDTVNMWMVEALELEDTLLLSQVKFEKQQEVTSEAIREAKAIAAKLDKAETFINLVQKSTNHIQGTLHGLVNYIDNIVSYEQQKDEK